MRSSVKLTALLLAIGAIFLTIGPCLAQTQPSMGSIRLVNASPDAPALDFYFNQTKTISSLKFKGISEYTEIADGNYDVKGFASPSDGTGTPVIELPGFTVNSGSFTTIVTVGLMKNKSVAILPLSDNNWLTSDGNKVKVRFIHGSPDAPAVNVEGNGVGDVFNNISFKSIGNYVTTTAGPFTLTVKTTDDPSKVVLISTLDLQAGKVYSVFVVGEVTGGGLATVVAVDNAISSMPTSGQGYFSSTQNSPGITSTTWLLIGLVLLLASSSLYYQRRMASSKK